MRKRIKFNGGQNISAPEEELAENEVVLSTNLSLNQKPGYLVKRPDSEVVRYGDHSPAGGSQAQAYFPFYKRNGDKYDLTFWTAIAVVVLKWVKHPVVGAVTSGLIPYFFSTGHQKIRGLPFGDRMLFTNGVDLMMFFENEDNYGKMEIVSPLTAPSGSIMEWLEAANGKILDPTLIQYKVSYYFDDDVDKESNTSPISELVDGQYMFEEFGIKKIKVTIPVSKNTRVTGRKIYRRHKNGVGGYADNAFDSFRLIATVANNIDTEYIDLIVTPGGDPPDLPVNTDTVPIAKYMENINNKVFYGNVIEPAEEAGAGFAYSQIFTITQSEGKTFTNPIVPITLQWNNPGADNYIKYGDFEANEGDDIKFMLGDSGIVTPLGFIKVKDSFDVDAKTVDFKIRMPELKTATGQEIVIFYGKNGMASLSNWEDLYRKELLYEDMIALFDMDKYKESNKIYNRKSANHGTFDDAHISFGTGDLGFFGGENTQKLSSGKHLDIDHSGYVDLDTLGEVSRIEKGTIAIWFKLGSTAPLASNGDYYTIVDYQNGDYADFGVYLRSLEDDKIGLVLISPSGITNGGIAYNNDIGINLWNGEDHCLLLSWEKDDTKSKWYVSIDGILKIEHTDDNSDGYAWGSGKHFYIGEYKQGAYPAGYNWKNAEPFYVDQCILWGNKCISDADEIEKSYLRETYFENAVGFVGGEPYSLAEKRCANKYYWSEGNVPENIPSINCDTVGSATEITQLIKLKNNLCILKKNEFRLIYNTEMAVEYWQFSDNLTGDVKNLGLIAPDSLDSIEGAIIGLAPLGVFVYNGSSFAYPGEDKLDPYLRGLSQTILQQAIGIYYPKRSEYWLYVNERLFILGVPSGRWTEYAGIEPTCFAIWEDDNGELVWADKDTFQIHKMLENFDSDRANEIAITCKSGKINLWQAQYQAMRLRFNDGVKVDVRVDIDGDSKTYEYLEDNKRRPLKLGSQGECAQFEMTENSKKPLEIKDMEFEYEPLARKV